MNNGFWVVITVDPMGVVDNMIGPFTTITKANDFIERHPKKFADLEASLNDKVKVIGAKASTYAGYVNDPFWDTYPDV